MIPLVDWLTWFVVRVYFGNIDNSIVIDPGPTNKVVNATTKC